MNSRQVLSNNLAKHMRRQRITNAGVLAKMSGVSRRGVGHILAKEGDARICTIEKLAIALGIGITDLLK